MYFLEIITKRQQDKRRKGQKDKSKNGQQDKKIETEKDNRTNGQQANRTTWQKDNSTNGQGDKRTKGQWDKWVQVKWTTGQKKSQQDKIWTTGQMNNRTNGQQDKWTTGQMDKQSSAHKNTSTAIRMFLLWPRTDMKWQNGTKDLPTNTDSCGTVSQYLYHNELNKNATLKRDRQTRQKDS